MDKSDIREMINHTINHFSIYQQHTTMPSSASMIICVFLALSAGSVTAGRPMCSRYLGNDTNVQEFVMRRKFSTKLNDDKRFKLIKSINALTGKRLKPQVWEVKHDGEVFGEVSARPKLMSVIIMRNKTEDTEVGSCRIALTKKSLLKCDWPVPGIDGRIKYDDKKNTGTVTAQRDEGFGNNFAKIHDLNTKGKLWNKDVGL